MTHENENEDRWPTLAEAMEQTNERIEQVRRNSTTTLEKIAGFFGIATYGSRWNQAVVDAHLFELSNKINENNREEFLSKVDAHAEQVASLFVSVARDYPRKKEVFIIMRGIFAFEIFRLLILKKFDSSSDFCGVPEDNRVSIESVYSILHGYDETASSFFNHNINRLVEQEREKKGIPQNSYNTYLKGITYLTPLKLCDIFALDCLKKHTRSGP